MIARELGLVLAGVNIRDDVTRDPSTYEIRFRGEIVGSGTLRVEKFMAIGDKTVLAALNGEARRDPIYGFPVKWIAPEDRDFAMAAGALVFDPISVLISHLVESARMRAALLFGRQEMQTLLEHLRASVPAVVKEVGTDSVPFALVHKAFVTLFRERVWPRSPAAALEAMIDAAASSRDARDLADAARKVLVPPLLYARKSPELPALMIDPEFESQLCATWLSGDGLAADPLLALHVRERVERYVDSVAKGQAFVVCTSPFRRHLSDLLDRFGLRVEVYAFGEVPGDISVRPAVIVTDPRSTLAAAG
jgi:flagellar biosynthesis protein FlhA